MRKDYHSSGRTAGSNDRNITKNLTLAGGLLGALGGVQDWMKEDAAERRRISLLEMEREFRRGDLEEAREYSRGQLEAAEVKSEAIRQSDRQLRAEERVADALLREQESAADRKLRIDLAAMQDSDTKSSGEKTFEFFSTLETDEERALFKELSKIESPEDKRLALALENSKRVTAIKEKVLTMDRSDRKEVFDTLGIDKTLTGDKLMEKLEPAIKEWIAESPQTDTAISGLLGGDKPAPETPKTYETPTAAAISELRANPSMKEEFDRLFGPGASDRYL